MKVLFRLPVYYYHATMILVVGVTLPRSRLLAGVKADGHDQMCRHWILSEQDLADVVMIAKVETTEGPLDADESDYRWIPPT